MVQVVVIDPGDHFLLHGLFCLTAHRRLDRDGDGFCNAVEIGWFDFHYHRLNILLFFVDPGGLPRPRLVSVRSSVLGSNPIILITGLHFSQSTLNGSCVVFLPSVEMPQ